MKPKPSPRQKKWPEYALAVVVVAVLAFAVGLGARQWLPEGSAAASAPLEAAPSSPDTQSPIGAEGNSAVANGIEVTISNTRYENGRLLVDVCFDLPDGEDWTLYEPTVKLEGRTVRWSETTPISLARILDNGSLEVINFAADGSHTAARQEAAPNAKGFRCDSVAFDLLSANGKPARLAIPAIVAEPREGEACSGPNLTRYQEAVSARFPGVMVACSLAAGVAGVEVLDVPAGTSLADVSSLTGSADFLLDVFGLRGPWSFQLTVP